MAKRQLAVPWLLCFLRSHTNSVSFISLLDAIKPFYEADRHAKTLLKKQLRGVRPIERALEERSTPQNDAIRDYCLAVRASLTDDGRSPLEASGLRLYDRLMQVSDSIARVQEKNRQGKGCGGAAAAQRSSSEAR